MDEAAVLATYGVPAARYAEFAILRGDPSDGLPGVRGVGETRARELILAYPDLGTMLQDAAQVWPTGAPLRRSPALRETLCRSAAYVQAMLGVVPIRTDVALMEWGGEPSRRSLDGLARRHGVQAPVRRLRDALAEGE